MTSFEKIFDHCFNHSSARALLIFASVFVLVSIVYAKEYVQIAFLTFFYAFVAHLLTTLRKDESLGSSFVGPDPWQVVWFTLKIK